MHRQFARAPQKVWEGAALPLCCSSAAAICLTLGACKARTAVPHPANPSACCGAAHQLPKAPECGCGQLPRIMLARAGCCSMMACSGAGRSVHKLSIDSWAASQELDLDWQLHLQRGKLAGKLGMPPAQVHQYAALCLGLLVGGGRSTGISIRSNL